MLKFSDMQCKKIRKEYESGIRSPELARRHRSSTTTISNAVRRAGGVVMVGNLPQGRVYGSLIETGKWRIKNHRKLYEVRCSHGHRRFISSDTLKANKSHSCRTWIECPPLGFSEQPEYQTVSRHFRWISKNLKNYKGMPFFDEWNPKKGGSYTVGAKWIILNLGKRIKGTSLHIIDHAKGFVPGNLEWTHPRNQSNQQMFKIIAQLRHKIKHLEAKLERRNGSPLH